MTTENTDAKGIVKAEVEVDASAMGLEEFATKWDASQTVTSKDGTVRTLEEAYNYMLDFGLHYRTNTALSTDEVEQVRADSLKLLNQKAANKLKVDLTINQSKVRQAALVTSSATKLENARKAKALKDGTTAPAETTTTPAPAPEAILDPTAVELNSDDLKIRGAAILRKEANDLKRQEQAAANGAPVSK